MVERTSPFLYPWPWRGSHLLMGRSAGGTPHLNSLEPEAVSQLNIPARLWLLQQPGGRQRQSRLQASSTSFWPSAVESHPQGSFHSRKLFLECDLKLLFSAGMGDCLWPRDLCRLLVSRSHHMWSHIMAYSWYDGRLRCPYELRDA